jgi:hypothetical protein
MYSEQMFEECEASSVSRDLLSVVYIVYIALFPSLLDTFVYVFSPWIHLMLFLVAIYI